MNGASDAARFGGGREALGAAAPALRGPIMKVDFVLLQALNGLSFGALLFLLASGFTLIFGLLRIVNLAHGALYLTGGYAALVTMTATGSFPLALLAAGIVVGMVGLVVERALLRRVRGRELPEVLLTIGVAFVLADLCLALFGGEPRQVAAPALLSGSLEVAGLAYPRFRVFVVVVAVVIGLGLYLLYSRTRLGAIIRAGVDDRETAAVLGIDVDRVFAGMFVAGSVLAGVAGAIGGAMLTV